MTTGKITLPILTKYEKTALLAKRTAAIANGSPITIKNPLTTDPYSIAVMELYAKTIPYKVVRALADGSEEIWSLKELKIIE